jgi:hypothetical protein
VPGIRDPSRPSLPCGTPLPSDPTYRYLPDEPRGISANHGRSTKKRPPSRAPRLQRLRCPAVSAGVRRPRLTRVAVMRVLVLEPELHRPNYSTPPAHPSKPAEKERVAGFDQPHDRHPLPFTLPPLFFIALLAIEANVTSSRLGIEDLSFWEDQGLARARFDSTRPTFRGSAGDVTFRSYHSSNP